MGVGRFVAGVAGAGIIGVFGAVSMQDETVRDDAGQIQEAGALGAFRIQVGDCYNDGAQVIDDETGVSWIEDVAGVPCAEPHDAQAYATFDLTDGPWPGFDAVIAAADEGCFAQFVMLIDANYQSSPYDYGFLYPSEESWSQLGDREVLCEARAYPSGQLTGPLPVSTAPSARG